MSDRTQDIIKKGIVANLLQLEKNYILAKKDLENNYTVLRSYHNSIKSDIIDRMLVSDLDEITYHKLVNKPILKEITIKELSNVVSKGILKHIMVSVDIEATRQNLKSSLKLSDVVIDPIIEAIKRVETTEILDLEEKANIKDLVIRND